MVKRLALQWPAAGLFAGPGAWAVSTQVNYALTQWFCAGHGSALLIIGVVLAAVAGLGALISFAVESPFRDTPDSRPSKAGEPRHWLAILGFFASVLFALIILTQTAAGFFLTGCER